MSASQADRREAWQRLRDTLEPGDTIWTTVLHVSRSGMTRDIQCFVIRDNEPRNLSRLIALATGFRFHRDRYAVRVGGCGMDMGFHIVYSLARSLWQESGFECTGDRCPSNDHSNGDRNREPHLHSDAGYALHHRWLG